ncbi:MAG: VTC domain-containing protein [Deltaproteobacteria bacterium]|nr:VTC domain-containing protein [Deltaproteobacteria bacterium]
MKSPVYMDRIEKKYEVGISQNSLPDLWRDVSRYVPLHEFTPGQQITWVNSVYFDNKDFDLLRLGLLNLRDNIHVRLRTYEYDSYPSQPISNYWLEMKIKREEVRRKKRLRIEREALKAFLNGKDVGGWILDCNLESADPENIRSSYREIRHTIFNLDLKPTLLVTYKRVAFQNGSERLSLDWDIHYYHIGLHVYRYPSWRDIARTLAVKADRVLLELKCPGGASPAWFGELGRNYPLREIRHYSKFNEGMSYLFPDLFKHYAESNYCLQMIKAYTDGWKAPLEWDG